jgi:predicted peptidase
MPLSRNVAIALLLACSVVLVGCARQTRSAHGSFVERELTIGGETRRYQVFVPAHRSGGKSPVILFLHGSGERGSDNHAQVPVGIGAYVRQHMDDFPAIVVFPQAPADSEWNQVADVVFAQLDAATREFGGDADRTYLTGLSMGGFGTWDYALRQPERFAALVPVCGGLVIERRPSMNVAAVDGAADPYAAAAAKLKDIPTWIFHGAKDDLVPPEFSRRMHAALQAAGAKDARYTEFPDANHNSWDPAYQHTPELWPWLFAQRAR